MHVSLTLRSRNGKTGPIPVSTTSAETCSDACPLKGGRGRYAEGGKTALQWRKVSEGRAGMAWQAFCEAVAALPAGQLWRHNQAGDLPGEGDVIARQPLSALIAANQGKRGFTYTHKPMAFEGNRQAVRQANAGGFTINLSANNLAHADELAALGIAPVVTVLPAAQTSNTVTPAGRKIVICPATQRQGVSCATCQLCQRAERGCIVGFPAHGMRKNAASRVAQGV